MRTFIKLAFLAALLGMLWGCTKDSLEIFPVEEQEIEMRGSAIQGQIFAPGDLKEFELSDPEAIEKLGGDMSRVRFIARPQAMPYAYLITTDEDEILHVSQSNFLDLATLMSGPGVYRIWAFAYKGTLLAQPGMRVHDDILASISYQPTSNFIRVSNRLPLMKKYAPQLKFSSGEEYFPSSVEWAFPFLKREKIAGKYWLVTKKALNVPNGAGSANYGEHMDFFRGNLSSAKVYAYWVERPAVGEGILDLVYFIYYPWNWGKSIGGTVFGNHVGDWENLTVRLKKEGDEFLPVRAYFPAHHFTNPYNWSEVEKTADGHPVAYVADGSHGMWKYAGSKRYGWAFWYGLWDHFHGDGIVWNTWGNLEFYDFNRKEGIGKTEWPTWMSDDFSNPGTGNPADPAAGAVFRWGNTKRGWVWTVDGYHYRVEDGPTGPVSKAVLNEPKWE